MSELEKRCEDRTIWIRGLYMILFAFLQGVAKFVLYVVAVIQFLSVLLTGGSNARLLSFGQGLSLYSYQIFLFLTFNSEMLPYPFSPWPDEDE